MKKLLTLTAVGTVLVCSDALASGFNLKEQSAAAQGNAFAGATAGAEDISYSFFNPAGLTRHKGTKISVGGLRRVPVPKGRMPTRLSPATTFRAFRIPAIPAILFILPLRRQCICPNSWTTVLPSACR